MQADADLRTVERDRCAPEDFYSTTNHRTLVRHGQAMDRGGKPAHGRAGRGERRAARACRRLRDIRAGDRVVVGMRGIRVEPESKERDRLAFAFMSNGISSERQVETAVRQTAALVRHAIEQGQKVVVVAGPVVVHTGGAAPLAALIRGAACRRLLSGNALGVHDIEAALFGTSLGVRLATAGRKSTATAITCAPSTPIYHCGRHPRRGGVRPAEERRSCTSA